MKDISRRDFIKAGAAATAAAGLAGLGSVAAQAAEGGAKAAARKPNLLFVFADQWRRQAVGFMKEDPVITPNMDRFAASGLALDNAVSGCPICSPYRAILLTGQYPQTNGVITNCASYNPGIGLKEDAVCISDVLKDAGYSCGYIGKWHLDDPTKPGGEQWDIFTPPGPKRHGFDFWYTYNCHSSHFTPWYFGDKPEKIRVKQWGPEHETDVAIDFINKKRDPDKPFALFISWNPPHPPYICPKEYRKKYEGKELPKRKNFRNDPFRNKKWGRYASVDDPADSQAPYFGAVSSLDDQFQRLLDTLAKQGLDKNTIVVLTSDHGEKLGSHGQMSKVSWHEESVGVPFMIRYPGVVKIGRDDLLLNTVDVMPTLLSLMGQAIPKSVEGRDLAKIMRGEKAKRPESMKMECHRHQPLRFKTRAEGLKLGWRAVRTTRYSYIAERSGRAARKLFDLKNDPYQMNPIPRSKIDKDLLAHLEGELRQWLKKTKDPFEAV